VSVLTQTMPGPPPGAGVPIAPDCFVLLVSVLFALVAAGPSANFSNHDFLAGDASVVAVEPVALWLEPAAVSFVFLDFFSAAGDAAGLSLAAAAVSFFFDFFFSAAGDAAGLSLAAGEGSFLAERLCFSAAGEALGLSFAAGEASFLAECLCLAGEAAGLSPGEGLCANTPTVVNARTIGKYRSFFILSQMIIRSGRSRLHQIR